MDIAAISPFATTVYREDRDRFYLVMLADGARRPDLLTLLAFNLDLSKIRTLVRGEDRAGLIRLQWWQEVITGDRPQEAAGHPLARALVEMINRCALPPSLLSEMIAARQADMNAAPFVTMAERATYVDQTTGILAELCGRILGATTENDLHACRLAGRKFGTIGLLRAVPYHGAEGWISLSEDKLANKGLTAEQVRSGRADITALTAVITDVLQEDMTDVLPHLPVSRPALPAALHGRIGRCYGHLLEQYKGNVFALPADLRPFALPLTLWWGQVRGHWW